MENREGKKPYMKASQEKPWLKYYKPEDLALVMPELSVVDFLLWRNKDRMEMPALNYFDRIFDFNEVFDNIYAAANSYAALWASRKGLVRAFCDGSFNCNYGLTRAQTTYIIKAYNGLSLKK